MKKARKLLAVTAIVLLVVMGAAPAMAAAQEGSVSVFVATDRHAKEAGNNLTAVLSEVAADSQAVMPKVAIIGGDSQNAGEFSVNDIYEELASVLGDDISAYYTYGSHDRQETGKYFDSFFSGPAEEAGLYLYGINYGQMIYANNQQAEAARYTGMDMMDYYGYSAEVAVPVFADWVKSLTDNKPIIIMSHVPLHLNRNDNLGASAWAEAINEAAKTHDIIFLWGHNHSTEEYEDLHGPSQDKHYYLVLPGETMPVQGPEKESSEEIELAFTYANAGYLKLGFGSLLTYSDTNGDGSFDALQIKRYSIDPEYDGAFSETGYTSPFTQQLTKWTTMPDPVALKGNWKEQTAYEDTDGYTVAGGSAAQKGTYTATLTLRDGYRWTDGSAAPRTVEYTVSTPVMTYVIIAAACVIVVAAVLAAVLLRKKAKQKV